MDIKTVSTDNAPAAIGPYSQGVTAGGFLFVSGQIGLDPKTGELTGPDFETQARQVFSNLREILAAGGSSLNQVTSVDVFLTDMSKFPVLNSIYADFFQDHRPARAAIEVSALPKGALIEVRCIAVCAA